MFIRVQAIENTEAANNPGAPFIDMLLNIQDIFSVEGMPGDGGPDSLCGERSLITLRGAPASGGHPRVQLFCTDTINIIQQKMHAAMAKPRSLVDARR